MAYTHTTTTTTHIHTSESQGHKESLPLSLYQIFNELTFIFNFSIDKLLYNIFSFCIRGTAILIHSERLASSPAQENGRKCFSGCAVSVSICTRVNVCVCVYCNTKKE